MVNKMPEFSVFIDDNFHYMDESERVLHSTFTSYQTAVEAMKVIIDRSLLDLYKPGMAAEELYSLFTGFGEEPFITPLDGNSMFSARTYARTRCDEICSG